MVLLECFFPALWWLFSSPISFSCSLRKALPVFLVVPLAVFLVLYFALSDFLVKGVTGKYFTAKQEHKELCLEKLESLQSSVLFLCVPHPVTTDAFRSTFSDWSHSLVSNEPDLPILRNLH